ncbi:hypothetical protein PV08_05926 [Exophiala spinifera]|uniref:NACHT domain-containing protein n=1 Tax=Exophiala spinifera TaxID=91928 RepID=A0A0D1YLG7_9EURO|nr:uncharacterized protein PV08_05926 [Exophiala spinifera]KIW15876.1 hypothetical protein PV08_05926 [Exophiala spinifera]
MGDTPLLDGLFESARAEFLAEVSKFPKSQRYDPSKIETIDDVYIEVMKIQNEQKKTKTLAALKRIEPFLNGLKEYFSAVDTFAQIKPEITCIVWGTLRLILQFANSLVTAFQKLIALLSDIGNILPNFKRYIQTGIFDNNDQVKRIMTLFYRDILDLHLEMLRFFSHRGLHMVLEALWPKFRTKLATIQENIGKHQSLMTSNVTFEHFLQALEHRQLSLKQYDEQRNLIINTELNEFREVLSSPLCLSRFQTSIENMTMGTGDWLFQDPVFTDWRNSDSTGQRCLCIQGIPGSGKTTLSARMIQKLQKDGETVLFSFLSHDKPSLGSSVRLLHSLLFQALVRHRDSVSAIYAAYNGDREKFNGDVEYNKDLFCSVIEVSGPAYIIIDGLDEIEEGRRKSLLKTLIEVVDLCGNIKLLISSRKEHDILQTFCARAVSLVINERNSKDIERYMEQQGEEWTDELRRYGADETECNELRNELQKVVIKADGMFLYAKLVVSIAKSQVDLEGIRYELTNLPDGLDQVYGRVLSRIQKNSYASKILQWLACAKTPLTELQLLQALLIKPSMSDFLGSRRTALLNLRQACGPIIEIHNDTVRFAHFTAYEYLFGKQSNNFLSHQNGHLEALYVSLTYLCFTGFDDIFSPELESVDTGLLRNRVLAGDFILFRYATQFWLDHAQVLGRADAQMTDALCDLVARFYRDRGQLNEDNDLESGIDPFIADFQSFNLNPTTRQTLSASARFHHRLKYGHISPQDEWTLEDPTVMSLGLRNFQLFLETMIEDCEKSSHAQECHCEKLKNMYGASIFRCKWPLCLSNSTGFNSSSEKKRHEQSAHRGRFICSEASCQYHYFGFSSSNQLAKHKSAVHVPKSQVSGSSEELEPLSTEDLLTILEDAVFHDQIEQTVNIIQLITERQELASIDFNLLLQIAAWRSRTCMVETLMPFSPKLMRDRQIQQVLCNAIYIAVELGNSLTVRALLTFGLNPKTTCKPAAHTKLLNLYFRPRKIQHTSHFRGRLGYDLITFARNKNDDALVEVLCNFGFKPTKLTFHGMIRDAFRQQQDLSAFSARWRELITDQKNFVSQGVKLALEEPNPAVLGFWLQHGADPNLRSIEVCGQSRYLPTVWYGTEVSLTPVEYVMSRLGHGLQEIPGPGLIEVISLLVQYGAKDPKKVSWKDRDIRGRKFKETNAKEMNEEDMKDIIDRGFGRVEEYFGRPWDEIFLAMQAGQDLEPYMS